MQPYENPAVPLQDCSPMEQLLQQDLLKRGCSFQNFFKNVHVTRVQLKSVATMENRNQCVCAVISHAHYAQVSHEEKIGIWSGAYLKGNTLPDYRLFLWWRCYLWWLVNSVCQSLPSLKNLPLFFCFNIYLLYWVHFWLHPAAVSHAIILFSWAGKNFWRCS